MLFAVSASDMWKQELRGGITHRRAAPF